MRPRLDLWLNHLGVQVTVVVLILTDLLVVTFLLLIDLSVIQDPSDDSASNLNGTDQKSYSVQTAEDVLHIIQLVLLCVFVLEITLRVIAKGLDILEDKWQIFDCLVVLVTVALYISLTAAVDSRTVTYSMGYIIAFRLWRVVRVFHDSREPVIRRAERIIIAHRKAWKQAEQRLKYAQFTIEKQQKEMRVLQEEVEKLQQLTPSSQSSPAGRRLSSYHSQPNLSTSVEDVTSDEETGYKSRAYVSRQVSVDVSPYKRTPNGSIPSGTPKGSMGSLPNGSVPGTPQSTCSHLFGERASVTSECSNGRVPDIVEDTQSADTRPSTRDPDLETGEKAHQRPHDNDPSGVSADLEHVDYVAYISQGKINEVGGAPTVVCTEEKSGNKTSDTHKFLRAKEKRSSHKRAYYVNSAYEAGDHERHLTEEERKEIRRVSQVPFGSSTYLQQEGIPMTDL